METLSFFSLLYDIPTSPAWNWGKVHLVCQRTVWATDQYENSISQLDIYSKCLIKGICHFETETLSISITRSFRITSIFFSMYGMGLYDSCSILWWNITFWQCYDLKIARFSGWYLKNRVKVSKQRVAVQLQFEIDDGPLMGK